MNRSAFVEASSFAEATARQGGDKRVKSENIVAVLVTSTETNEQALAVASVSTTLRASVHRKRLVFWDHPFVIKEGWRVGTSNDGQRTSFKRQTSM